MSVEVDKTEWAYTKGEGWIQSGLVVGCQWAFAGADCPFVSLGL